MHTDWGAVHKAEGSHIGWSMISIDSSDQVVALYDCVYVIISSSSGALWSTCCAGEWMRPVE